LFDDIDYYHPVCADQYNLDDEGSHDYYQSVFDYFFHVEGNHHHSTGHHDFTSCDHDFGSCDHNFASCDHNFSCYDYCFYDGCDDICNNDSFHDISFAYYNSDYYCCKELHRLAERLRHATNAIAEDNNSYILGRGVHDLNPNFHDYGGNEHG
jgi:hypothetical protein